MAQARADGAGEPAFIEEDVEIVFAEGLAMLHGEEFLDFAGLAGLLAELPHSHRDLAGDLAGRCLAFSLFRFFDEFRGEWAVGPGTTVSDRYIRH